MAGGLVTMLGYYVSTTGTCWPAVLRDCVLSQQGETMTSELAYILTAVIVIAYLGIIVFSTWGKDK